MAGTIRVNNASSAVVAAGDAVTVQLAGVLSTGGNLVEYLVVPKGKESQLSNPQYYATHVVAQGQLDSLGTSAATIVFPVGSWSVLAFITAVNIYVGPVSVTSIGVPTISTSLLGLVLGGLGTGIAIYALVKGMRH